MSQKNADQFRKHSALLTAMSNPKRLELLALISAQEWKVGELADKLKLSQSALSQHLGKLRDKKIVNTRRDAQTIYYTCTSDEVLKILAVLETFDPDEYSGNKIKSVA